MREKNYDKLLFISIAVLIVSAFVLLISGYNFYFKIHDVVPSTIKKPSDSITLSLRVNNSLKKNYSDKFVFLKNNLNTLSTHFDKNEE